MIVINCEQGTPEWFEARCGVVTASNFEEVCKVVDGLTEKQELYVKAILSGLSEGESLEKAGYSSKPRITDKLKDALDGKPVGDFSNAAKDYAFKIAIERISGELVDEEKFETWQMRRGRELEPDARHKHELKTGVMIEETGIALTDDGKFGASVDGTWLEHSADSVYENMSEYKCFTAPGSLRPILIDKDISKHEYQVQGGLWIGGYHRAHFCLYCPQLKKINKELTVFTVERNDDFIEKMEARLLEFDKLICKYMERLSA